MLSSFALYALLSSFLQPTSIAKQKVVQMMSTRLHLYVLLLCMSEFKVFMHNAMHNVFQIRGYSKDLLNS